MKNATFFISIVGLAIGVLSGEVGLSLYFSFSIIATALAVYVLYYFYQERIILLFFIFLLSFGLGLARDALFRINNVPDESLLSLTGEEVNLEGRVLKEPKNKDNYRQIILSAERVGGKEVKDYIIVFAPFYPEVSYGDRIFVKGQLLRPDVFETDRGDTFDYRAYLEKDKIHFQIFYPEIEVLESGGGSVVTRTLFTVKDIFLEKIERVVPEPHAALLGGILLGREESLGDRLIDDFRKTGIIHIVVLSGFNIAIVATAITAFARTFFSLKFAGTFAVLGIVLFAIMVGGGATVVRASIMALLAIFARHSGRSYDAGKGLFLAGALMLVHNPSILVQDASFQLSFLATAGLIYLSPIIEKYFMWVTDKFGLREIILATISAQVFVFPWILYKMGLFSVVSLPVNLLVLPTIPILMLVGFISGLIALFWITLSLPFSYITYLLLGYILWVVDFFSSLPFASFEIPPFSIWIAIFVYTVLIAALIYLHRKVGQTSDTEVSKEAKEFKIVEVVES